LASDFHEATLDNVGVPQLTPQMLRKVEEAQQLRQVFLQLAHHGGIRLSPARSKTPAGLLRCNGDEKRETGWEQFLPANAAMITPHLSSGIPKSPNGASSAELRPPMIRKSQKT
jgi:hypothetical protein